jgi:hypothetical protein
MTALSPTPDARIDRLYRNLPAIYRITDAEHGYPLQALLRTISEQVNLVEDDIAHLYDNWFIETADDWAVPYIADLLGFRPATTAGTPSQTLDAAGRALNRVLVPRREIANLIRNRRRKGTIALLEDLSRDVAGWPARALEFFQLLDRAQHLNHPHLDRLGTASLRDMQALDRVDTPFDPLAHSVDVRRANSRYSRAEPRNRYNIPNVGVFVWRMRSYPVTRTPAYCAEDVGAHCFTFSVLGQDAPLYRRPQPEPGPSHIAEEANLPVPIRRRAMEASLTDLYGEARDLAIWAEQWAGYDPKQPLPASALIVADLSGWRYKPRRGKVAIDPVLGRLMFPPTQLPKKGVRVSYRYGFSSDIGGGEYLRPMRRPAEDFTLYQVGDDTAMPRIADALRQWRDDAPQHAVIELVNSGVWVEPLHIRLHPGQTLILRAANGVRPVIRLIDWQTDLPDALLVELDVGCRFALDGVIVTGRPLHVTAPRDVANSDVDATETAHTPDCAAEVLIRHCTLVPGWGIGCDCEPERPAEPSLELNQLAARVRIEHSIVGSIQVQQDEVGSDPIRMSIEDSIVDAADGEHEAIGGAGSAVAHTTLTIKRSTVFGIVEVHALELAENSLFNDCLNVARRQIGCMRFCHVPRHCRTPRRYRCQPDQVVAAVREQHLSATAAGDPEAERIASEVLRVRPRYDARRYGHPGYARLSVQCADEIKRGADDESEMGVYHDLFQPQREANLRARLDEYTPAGMTVGLLFAD